MIRSGTFAFSQADPGWTLHTGTGHRDFASPDLPFELPFASPPMVVVFLAGIDATGDVHVDVYPSDVQKEEFNIHVAANENAQISAVRVGFLAWD